MPSNYPEEPTSIGEHIRKKRLELNLMQSEVALMLQVSTDSVTYWENNRSSPQISFYPKIIAFLGYNPLQFDETTISGRIKAYRYRNGTTTKNFGKLLAVDQTTVTEWENGNRTPSVKFLVKLETLLTGQEL